MISFSFPRFDKMRKGLYDLSQQDWKISLPFQRENLLKYHNQFDLIRSYLIKSGDTFQFAVAKALYGDYFSAQKLFFLTSKLSETYYNGLIKTKKFALINSNINYDFLLSSILSNDFSSFIQYVKTYLESQAQLNCSPYSWLLWAEMKMFEKNWTDAHAYIKKVFSITETNQEKCDLFLQATMLQAILDHDSEEFHSAYEQLVDLIRKERIELSIYAIDLRCVVPTKLAYISGILIHVNIAEAPLDLIMNDLQMDLSGFPEPLPILDIDEVLEIAETIKRPPANETAPLKCTQPPDYRMEQEDLILPLAEGFTNEQKVIWELVTLARYHRLFQKASKQKKLQCLKAFPSVFEHVENYILKDACLDEALIQDFCNVIDELFDVEYIEDIKHVHIEKGLEFSHFTHCIFQVSSFFQQVVLLKNYTHIPNPFNCILDDYFYSKYQVDTLKNVAEVTRLISLIRQDLDFIKGNPSEEQIASRIDTYKHLDLCAV